MRFYILALALVGAALPMADAVADLNGESGLQVRSAIGRRCSDQTLKTEGFLRTIRDIKARLDRPARMEDPRWLGEGNRATDAFLIEMHFSRYLKIKSECVHKILLEELGEDFRMEAFNGARAENLLAMIRRMHSEAEALQESSLTASAMAKVFEHLIKKADKAEADADYLTLNGYSIDRLSDLDNRVRFFEEGTRPQNQDGRSNSHPLSGDSGSPSLR